MKNTYKRVSSLFCFLITANSYALDFDDLFAGLHSSLDEFSGNKSELVSWTSKITGDSVEVKLLEESGEISIFSCFASDCNLEEVNDTDLEFKMPSSSSWRYARRAERRAIYMFSRNLERRNIDPTTVTTLKTWVDVKEKSDHSDRADIWSKFSYFDGQTTGQIYTICHSHGGQKIVCHFSKKGSNEPKY